MILIPVVLWCFVQGCSQQTDYRSYGINSNGTIQSCSKCASMGPHGSLCDYELSTVMIPSGVWVADSSYFMKPNYVFYGMPPDTTCTIYVSPTICFDGPQTISNRVQFDTVLAPYIDTTGIYLFDFEEYNLTMAAHCDKCNRIGPHGSVCEFTVGWVSALKKEED